MFLAVTLGIASGLLSTLFGVGGGVLFVSFLPALGLSTITAIGTSLCVLFLISGTNTFRFHKLRLVKWPVVFRIMPFALVFSYAAGRVALNLDSGDLKFIFAIVVTGLFIFSLLRSFIKQSSKAGNIKSVLLGSFAGVVAGITGLGAGSVISFFLLNWNVVKNKNVVPTTNAIMVFTTFAAGIAHVNFVQNVRIDLAVLIFLSSQIVVPFFTKRQKHLSKKPRLIGLVCIFAIISIKAWLNVSL